MLLPLPEPAFLELDLLGKSFSEHLLLFLEFRVINLFNLCFSEFTRLHLSESVGFVMVFFGRGDKVQHVGSDKEGSKLLEITVVFVLHCIVSLTSGSGRSPVADLPQHPIGILDP
jgi:hypothetical protein